VQIKTKNNDAGGGYVVKGSKSILSILSIALFLCVTAADLCADEFSREHVIEILNAGDNARIEELKSEIEQLGAEAVPVLVDCLKVNDYNVQKGALEFLVSLGSRAESAVPTLIELLSEGTDEDILAQEDNLTLAVGSSLGRMGDIVIPFVRELVEADLTDSLPLIWCIGWLEGHLKREFVEYIVAYMRTPNISRDGAGIALGMLVWGGGPVFDKRFLELSFELRDELNKSFPGLGEDGVVTFAALLSQAIVSDYRVVVPRLISKFEDEPKEQEFIAEAMTSSLNFTKTEFDLEWFEHEMLPFFIDCLGHPNSEIRIIAVTGMWYMSSIRRNIENDELINQCIAALQANLEDPDENLVVASLQALRVGPDFYDEAYFDFYWRFLDHSNPEVREEAITIYSVFLSYGFIVSNFEEAQEKVFVKFIQMLKDPEELVVNRIRGCLERATPNFPSRGGAIDAYPILLRVLKETSDADLRKMIGDVVLDGYYSEKEKEEVKRILDR